MGPSFEGTKSAGGVSQGATQTSITSVDYRYSHCPWAPAVWAWNKGSLWLSKGRSGQACATPEPQDRCARPFQSQL